MCIWMQPLTCILTHFGSLKAGYFCITLSMDTGVLRHCSRCGLVESRMHWTVWCGTEALPSNNFWRASIDSWWASSISWQNLSNKHPLVDQSKCYKFEQRHFFCCKNDICVHATFVDPLWLIVTVEYIALCHYLWFNDDVYPVWLIATIEYIALVTR